MSEKAARFMAEGQEVIIAGQPVKIQPQTIGHNLKFLRFIGEVMAEANEIGGKEFTKENVANVLMGAIETKLVELAQLIAPGVSEEQVFNAYFDEWAEAIEVYLKLNFFKVYQAVMMAMQIRKKAK
ncbi:hypothetical protein ACFO25_09900 [Paenactinomyces guangxiensis]|uniref:Tail assembly chaperone n=1 Tax=Paenactinomyces guangxiensis TaxID=1490290 RepID=A0A7W1WSB1_9BACL|nr:hypothetical protein [Paenactinomyces guangxiensis]MBA4495097.1 hypothetical protein [Paenactinomyces guangxiensis]MBH8592219.1 hypothetical protein [Paenactinomyces guangxiensis]